MTQRTAPRRHPHFGSHTNDSVWHRIVLFGSSGIDGNGKLMFFFVGICGVGWIVVVAAEDFDGGMFSDGSCCLFGFC